MTWTLLPDGRWTGPDVTRPIEVEEKPACPSRIVGLTALDRALLKAFVQEAPARWVRATALSKLAQVTASGLVRRGLLAEERYLSITDAGREALAETEECAA